MIYLITNKINNKRYIGKTQKPIKTRWYYHCKNASYGIDTALYRAIRKYGEENFTIEYLCEGSDAEEILAISSYKPEYNMTKGGDGGDTSASPRYLEAMKRRDMSGKNNPMYGKKGINNPNYGKKYGPNPRISESKKKVLICSNGNIFYGFQQMFDFYSVRSYYSLKKIGITWSEKDDS